MNRKELVVQPIKNNPQQLEIRFAGGGEVPQVLSGMYTSRSEADKAITKYLATRYVRKPKKEITDVESSG